MKFLQLILLFNYLFINYIIDKNNLKFENYLK